MITDPASLVQPVISMIVVLILLAAVLWGLKYYMHKRPLRGRRLQFLEAMPVGQKERVVMLKVDQRTLLLGVTPQSVSLIAEIDSAVEKVQEGVREERKGSADRARFSEKFHQIRASSA